jgi:arylsulfatase A-like enzyme
MKINAYIIILLLSLVSCKKDNTTDNSVNANTSKSPNILLIIADDFGLDACPGYDVGSEKPNMPIIESLSSTGLKFNNLWANPTCTPTRATILTGKYGFRTNVLKVGDELATSETSLQTYINNNSKTEYSQAVIGKWHLSTDENHPKNMGVDYYKGLITGAVKSYWNWPLTNEGETSTITEYATTKFTDIAIDWTSKQENPWFLWLAYNAPHTPFHLPPVDLHSRGDLPNDEGSISDNPLPYYFAALEAMDSEIGRILNSFSDEVRENTIIIIIGDNGTPNLVVQEYNSHRAKGSIYQGGVNVPMIISGKGVTRFNETENSLINTTDLFSTIANITGASASEIHDSKSFYNLLSTKGTGKRDFAYTEVEYSSGGVNYTIRNNTHKYILFENNTEALYDLKETIIDKINLLSTNQLPLSKENEEILAILKSKANEIRQ